MDTNLNGVESFARIVLIDDDCDNLAYLVALLSRRGIRCAAFWRSQEALEYIRSHPVSLVVTDIFMPEVDGVQLISAIKSCRPATAVIAVSGYNQSYLRCMKALGATASISKPIDPTILAAAVDRCLDPAFTGELCQA
ncbi:MAG: two-component system response regulator [Kiloniellaceae bacterium]